MGSTCSTRRWPDPLAASLQGFCAFWILSNLPARTGVVYHHVEPFHQYGSSIVTLHRAELAIFRVPLITATLCLHRVARQRLLNELRTKMLKNVLVNEKP